MNQEQKKSIAEDVANFFEKLHYGLGAAALVGALLVPPLAEGAVIFSAYEFGHGALWNYLKKKFGKNTNKVPEKG